MKLRNLIICCLLFTFFGFCPEYRTYTIRETICHLFANFYQGITGSAKNETAFELARSGAFGESDWIAGWTLLAE